MKWLFVILLGLVSCKEQRSQPDPRPTLVTGDASLLKADSVNPYAPIDVSPMDMSYFPEDYPIEKMSGKVSGPPVVRVIYSRPHRQGRKIFGALLKYGEPWRLGANEASEIEFFQPVSIQGKKIARGKYIIYAIPQEKKWTIILNSNLNTWGLKPEPKDDLYKFDIPVQSTSQPVEYFSMVFQKTSQGADLLMAWDTVVARLPLQF
ncbi:MAG: DUF2911 domain-containing protein [Flavisolibacter sp.]